MWGLPAGHERGKQLPFLSGTDASLLFPRPWELSQAASEETQQLSCLLSWLIPKAFPNLRESLEIILSFNKYLLSVCSVLVIDLALGRQQ